MVIRAEVTAIGEYQLCKNVIMPANTDRLCYDMINPLVDSKMCGRNWIPLTFMKTLVR